MSNTPPVRQDDPSRLARNYPSYLYPGATATDLAPTLLGSDQTTTLAPYRSSIDFSAESQIRQGAFRGEPGTSSRNEAKTVRAQEDDVGYRMRNDTAKTRDMDPSLDGDLKDAMEMAIRNGEYANSYQADSMLRNFQKPKEQRALFSEMPAYDCLQSQPSLDPRMSGLQPQFLPQTSMYSQLSQYRQMFTAAFLPRPYHVADISPFSDRRNINPGYVTSGHIGQGLSSSGQYPYPDYHKPDADRGGIYGKYPSSYGPFTKKSIETDPRSAPILPPSNDPYSHYLTSSYPRSAINHIDSNRKYQSPASNSQNGIKPTDPSVIDLTNSNSPELYLSSITRNDPTQRDRKLPSSHTPGHRNTPKENGAHPQQDVVKGWNSSRRNQPPSVGSYPVASMSPFSSLFSTPVHPMSIPSPYNSVPFDSSLNDISRSKGIEPGHAKQGTGQWLPSRHHTPSPRQYIMDSKKNGSPSLHFKSKTVPQTAPSDLMFNYPEGSGSKQDKPPHMHTKHNIGNGILPGKTPLWPKRDDSKLSPWENHVMDSARDGKPCQNFSGKFDNVPHVNNPRYQQTHRAMPLVNNHPVVRTNPPEYTPPVKTSEDMVQPKTNADLARNSVIQSAPKLVSHLERVTHKIPQDTSENKSDSLLIGNVKAASGPTTTENFAPPKNVQRNENVLPEPPSEVKDENDLISLLKPGRKRRASSVKDGVQKPKRKYVKQSPVWQNMKGRRKKAQKHEEVTEQKEVVRAKELPDTPTVEDEKHVLKADFPASKEVKVGTTIKSSPVKHSPSKKTRPQRRSSGIDMDEEYLYGWFTEEEEEEVENDDSSDEDYSCKTKVPSKFKTRGITKALRQRRRSSRSREDDISSDYSESSHWEQRPKRRGRRRAGYRIKSVESIPEDSSPVLEEKHDDASSDIKYDNSGKAIEKHDSLSEKQEDTVNNMPTDDLPKDKNSESAQLAENEVNELSMKPRLKYKRRLDQDGRPIKRRRRKNKKSVEHIIPKKKKKHLKLSNYKSNATTPLFPSSETKESDQACKVPDTDVKSLPEGAHGYTVQSTDKRNENETGTVPHSDQPHDATVAATNTDSVPVKTRKKPGRKPGWRKYPQPIGNANPSAVTQAIHKKKYKKPKGDGLCRFGMRKRGRRSKLRPNLTKVEAKPKTSTGITTTPIKSETVSNKKELPLKPKRKYDMTSRLEKKRLRLISLGKVPPIEEKPSTSDVADLKNIPQKHKVSQELQSQEYDYDFESLTLYYGSEDNAVEENDVETEQTSQDPEIDHSPLGTPKPTDSEIPSGTPCTPFPSNLKKLTCNSAIGETPLHKASRMCYVDNLLYYLENGANVNQSDNAGYTALHEACVHNHLEAASILLEFSADVNKYADDGTRPLHDAVEYDHLEMVRLMLASGADPLLSKFSGRAIPNMIRSEGMRKFLDAYLHELKERTECEDSDEGLEWNLPCSSVLDKSKPHVYSALDFAPDTDDLSMEFELFDEEPIPTYLLQPDEESERANYCLLDDYIKATDALRTKPEKKIRIVTMPVDKFRTQIRDSKLQNLQYESRTPKPNLAVEYVELIAVDDEINKILGAESIRLPLFEKTSNTHKVVTDKDSNNSEENSRKDVSNGEMQSETASFKETCHTMTPASKKITSNHNGELYNDDLESKTEFETNHCSDGKTLGLSASPCEQIGDKLVDVNPGISNANPVDRVR